VRTDFFHLGNVPNFTFTPAVTKLDHFSSMAGTKLKDKSIVTEKTATVKITMEEFTKRNLGIMLMGDVNDTDPDNITIDMFSKTALTGELRFYATNDVGPRWRFFLNRCSSRRAATSRPSRTTTPTWSSLATCSRWTVSGVLRPSFRAGAPENITLPFIVGTLHRG
jgi:hypothetical protein